MARSDAFGPRERITRDSLNKRLSAPADVRLSGPRVNRRQGQAVITDEEEIHIKITGTATSPRRYAWQEVSHDSQAGTWLDTDRTGTVDSDPAFEANNATVPTGSKVYTARRSRASGAWLFFLTQESSGGGTCPFWSNAICVDLDNYFKQSPAPATPVTSPTSPPEVGFAWLPPTPWAGTITMGVDNNTISSEMFAGFSVPKISEVDRVAIYERSSGGIYAWIKTWIAAGQIKFSFYMTKTFQIGGYDYQFRVGHPTNVHSPSVPFAVSGLIGTTGASVVCGIKTPSFSPAFWLDQGGAAANVTLAWGGTCGETPSGPGTGTVADGGSPGALPGDFIDGGSPGSLPGDFLDGGGPGDLPDDGTGASSFLDGGGPGAMPGDFLDGGGPGDLPDDISDGGLTGDLPEDETGVG